MSKKPHWIDSLFGKIGAVVERFGERIGGVETRATAIETRLATLESELAELRRRGNG